jgi:6-phosphogluconolactonase
MSILPEPLSSPNPLPLWIGTGGKGSKGIYRTMLNLETGKLTDPVLAAEIGSPGFVALNADRTRLYSLCNVDGGSVAAFSIGADHSLTLLNTQSTGDGSASHLSLDRTGRLLFSAQYGSGSITVYPVSADGHIGERTQVIKHSGSGPNKDRQEGPHPHFAGASPDNRFLLVPDLGSDQVVIYRIDHESATLSPHGAAVLAPGSGPRHLKFSHDGTMVYLVNELSMTVTVFEYNAEGGTMTPLQTIATLPGTMWKVPNKAAEIRLHPTGKFVYASNRGHDSITVFSVDEASGLLTYVEREAIRGAYPRNFNIDPTGKWLIAAGRASNTLSVFSINAETGMLYFTTDVLNVPDPICVEW